MANLYLTEQNSILRKSGDRLIVQKDNETLLEVQCHKIDAVLLFGNVQFTTQAVHELFEHGIEMAVLSRTGRLIGQITSPLPKNIFLRINQFKKYDNPEFRLTLSQSFIWGKISNCLSFLRMFSFNHPDATFKSAIEKLSASLKAIDAASSIEQLLGLEGNAANTYFQAFSKMILGDFGFPGRVKHPATDPVNGLLSLTYTMIFNEISSLLDGLGFDPYLGYYHAVHYGRASLAGDLTEEFRAPIGERLTLYLINKGIFKPNDFYTNPKSGGAYLRRAALKRYFVEYEKFLTREFVHPETASKTTLRKCFRIQAEKLAGTIQRDIPYVPYLMSDTGGTAKLDEI